MEDRNEDHTESVGHPALLREWKLVQPLWGTARRLLTKLNIELPYDPAIPPLSTHPGKTSL